MKKITFALLVTFAIVLASCGGKAKKTEDVDSTKIETVATDSTVVDSVVVE
jgi:hypothetical protein